MAPMAPHGADVEQDGFVLPPGRGKRFFAPLVPVNRLVHGRAQIGGGSFRKSVEGLRGHKASLMVCAGRLQGLGGNEECRSENSECRIKNAELRMSRRELEIRRFLCVLCAFFATFAVKAFNRRDRKADKKIAKEEVEQRPFVRCDLWLLMS